MKFQPQGSYKNWFFYSGFYCIFALAVDEASVFAPQFVYGPF